MRTVKRIWAFDIAISVNRFGDVFVIIADDRPRIEIRVQIQFEISFDYFFLVLNFLLIDTNLIEIDQNSFRLLYPFLLRFDGPNLSDSYPVLYQLIC